MNTSFRLEGNRRKDGFIRFTCDELPGFRLLLQAKENVLSYDQDIKDALQAFVPLYVAAEARNKSIGIEHRERVQNGLGEQGIEVVASFAA